MPERINYLNVADIAGKASNIRSASQGRKLRSMQIEDIETARETKKARENVMKDYYTPPGTKDVTLGEPGAENAMVTPGRYDYKGAAAALAGMNDIKGSLELSKAGREAKREGADLKIKLMSVDKAERAKVMSDMTLLRKRSAEGISKYEAAMKSGRSHEEAIQDIDPWYDSVGEQLIGLGISAKDIPQQFDPVKARAMMVFADEAGVLDIEQKRATIAKTRAEAGKIKTDKARGGTRSEKRGWHSNAKGVLGSLYGNLTDQGYVIDPARMKEYQKALTYLEKYRGQNLDPNSAAVQASEEANKFGTVDTLPEGAVYFGTENGVELYRTPDGKVYKKE